VQKRQIEFKIITQKIFILLPCLFFIQWSHLFGKDNNAISTSRPGIGNSTSAVLTGLYQFELGTNLTLSPGMDTTITVPILIRLGVMENTDLQIGYTGSALTLGVLYGGIHIINGLENSIMLTTSLPFPMNGSSYEENNDSLIEYSAYLPISYSFQNGFSVESQIAGTFYNNEEINPIMSYSLAIGSSLGKNIGWFFEAYQSQTIGNESTTENIPITVDYGITYLFNNIVKLDLSMGLTFQKDDSDYIETERFLEGGVSFRLPK